MTELDIEIAPSHWLGLYLVWVYLGATCALIIAFVLTHSFLKIIFALTILFCMLHLNQGLHLQAWRDVDPAIIRLGKTRDHFWCVTKGGLNILNMRLMSGFCWGKWAILRFKAPKQQRTLVIVKDALSESGWRELTACLQMMHKEFESAHRSKQTNRRTINHPGKTG